MNAARMFWGSFFVLLGALFLLEIVGAFVPPYVSAWRLWPLILVLIGLAVLLREYKGRWIFAALGGILFALILYDAFQSVWPPRSSSGDTGPLTQEFALPYEPPVERASLRIDAPAGAFHILDSTGLLITAKSRSGQEKYSLTGSRSGNLETLELECEAVKAGWLRGSLRNRIDVWLNPAPVWDINVDVGAARLNLDLRPFQVSLVNIDAGAANVEIRLGTRYGETTLRIDAGAASVRLLIPEEAGCELREDSGVLRKNLRGMEKIRSGLYRTKNFHEARQKIFVDMDLGLARLHVERVPQGSTGLPTVR